MSDDEKTENKRAEKKQIQVEDKAVQVRLNIDEVRMMDLVIAIS